MRSAPAALLLLALIPVACTSDGEPGPGADPTIGSPTPTATQAAIPTQPLALAVNVRRPPLGLSEATARRLVRGQVRDWSGLGQPAGPLTVVRERTALRNLPLGAVAV